MCYAHSRAERGRLRHITSSRECASTRSVFVIGNTVSYGKKSNVFAADSKHIPDAVNLFHNIQSICRTPSTCFTIFKAYAGRRQPVSQYSKHMPDAVNLFHNIQSICRTPSTCFTTFKAHAGRRQPVSQHSKHTPDTVNLLHAASLFHDIHFYGHPAGEEI